MKLIKSNNKKNTNIKFRKKILIISQLKKQNNIPKSSAIYLNEGCLPSSLIGNDFNRKLVPDYPHLKRQEVYKNYYYLLNVYEFFLKVISYKLNKIHNVSYSKNYWRVVIGVWLFQFISIIFDNWNKLRYIKKKYNLQFIEIAKIKNSAFLFNDYNDFAYKTLTDSFNNSIYNDLLKFFKKYRISYFTIKKEFLNNNFYSKNILNVFLNFLKNLYILISNFLQKDKNAVFHDPYFDNKTSLLLQIKLKQIPTFYKSINITNKFYNHKIRLQEFKNLKDPFVKIVANLIFKYMPLSYLENYNYYLNKINSINWPKDPKFIFSSNSFFYDDFFKFWLAEKKEKFKTKFISGQHGGYFFTNKFMFFEKHQNEISDLILTWGYNNKKKCRSVFNLKTLNKKIKFDNNGKLLFVNYEVSRFSGVHSSYTRFSYFDYLKDQLNFIYKLNKNIANEIIFRKYPINHGWKVDLINLLKKNQINVLIDKNKKIYDTLKISKICFANLNSTVYLETLNLNFPTIIFFNTDNDEVNKKTMKYLNILKQVGVYFDSYETAAKKINEIWDNVDNWWYSKSVQKAVNIFCNKYSKRSKKNTINKLYNTIIN